MPLRLALAPLDRYSHEGRFSLMIQPEPASNTPTYAERVIGRDIEMSVAYGNGQVDIAAAVAQALADQRAKYEAVADELEQHAAAHNARAFDYRSAEMPSTAASVQAFADAQVDAAQRIRRVA